MKTSGAKIDCCGFTLIELLAVIAIIAIVAAMLMPAGGGRSKARNFVCQRNLKDIGEGFESWKSDHAEMLPMQISVTNGGTKELVSSGSVIIHFQALTGLKMRHEIPEIQYGTNLSLSYTGINQRIKPTTLLCSGDRRRDYQIKSLETLSDTNISYFVGVDAWYRNPGSILAGDRHLELNQKALEAGLFKPNANSTLAWSPEMHRSLRGGNLLFIDGHVEFVRSNKLNATFQRQTLPYGRLAIP